MKPLPLALLAATLAAGPAPAAERGASAAYWRQPAAAAAVNRALQTDPRSPRLNYLNGLLYEAGSAQGPGLDLARVGYQLALKNDPSFWPAAYQLGLLAMDDRDALQAERWFLAALENAPADAGIAYGLARAAYCAGDYAVAAAALERAVAIAPPADAERYLTAALVKAAAGDREAAAGWLARYGTVAEAPQFGEAKVRTEQLLRRVAYAGPPPGEPQKPEGAPAPAPAPPAPLGATRGRTAIIDVIFLRRDVGDSTGAGLNVLDMLNLNLAGSLVNASSQKVRDNLAGKTVSDGTTRSRSVAVDVPTVTYSLNVANASGGQSAIEGHPSLLVYEGQSSSLFSGNTVTYGVSGNTGGSSFTKDVGLNLSVKPQFRDDGSVNLTVTATMETFVQNGLSTFSQEIATQKDTASIVADLDFDQAILVSAGSLYKKGVNISKTPLLGDIPGPNMAFRRSDKYEKRTDLYILMALRRVGGDETAVRQELRRQIDGLLRRAGVAVSPFEKLVDGADLAETETHADFYRVENPGRRLDPAFITRVGLTPDLVAPRGAGSTRAW